MKKQHNLPLVSIITPAFNRERYIQKTIQSVLKQDYPNIEHIVINDGSEDKTLEIIKKYSTKVIVYTQKNIGEQKAVNRGFKIAKGEIISVLNSDDLLFPNAVSQAVSAFHNNPSAIVAYPDWVIIDEKDNQIKKGGAINYSFEHMIKRHDCIPSVGTFFKQSLLKTLKGRDESFTYVSDYDFWLRAGLIGQFIRIPMVLAAFREHYNSTTTKMTGQKMGKEHIRVIDKFYKNSHLPPGIIKIKKMAYASANIVAGITSGKNYIQKYTYFFRSLQLYPIYAIRKLVKKFFSFFFEINL